MAAEADVHWRAMDDVEAADEAPTELIVLATAHELGRGLLSLGLSYPTTRRRIAALMEALGVESRFEAGVYAARNG